MHLGKHLSWNQLKKPILCCLQPVEPNFFIIFWNKGQLLGLHCLQKEHHYRTAYTGTANAVYNNSFFNSYTCTTGVHKFVINIFRIHILVNTSFDDKLVSTTNKIKKMPPNILTLMPISDISTMLTNHCSNTKGSMTSLDRLQKK